MTLMKSISGIRGTIGGKAGEGFTPVDIVECTAAYAKVIRENFKKPSVVVGRDGRMTGEMVNALVVSTLMTMGINVMDVGLSTTPTVEMCVKKLGCQGGIILTASHNPKEWNALKFLNENGEFISEEQGHEILNLVNKRDFEFVQLDHIGNYEQVNNTIDFHIDEILRLDYILVEKIKEKKFNIVVDCINSTGAISVIPLLKHLGCTVVAINDSITGNFAHNPEPLPEHLTELSQHVISINADMGISIDPDVDRLAFVCEDGTMFGEEYTLVACADYILSIKKGNTVSNLSSTRALRDVTISKNGIYFPSKVGEVNVVKKMKEVHAVIGGEGNGGIILPDLHYGRDALVGIAIFLSLLVDKNLTLTQLKKSYPQYFMTKDKIELGKFPVNELMKKLQSLYKSHNINTEDGMKIDFENSWVHMRTSNTEPIMRIYAEAKTSSESKELVDKFKAEIKKITSES